MDMIPIPLYGVDLPELPAQCVIDDARNLIAQDDKKLLTQFDVMIARMRVAAFHNSPGGRLIDSTSGRL
jgi:hypothetical protein